MKPPSHPQEAARLAALHRLDILDTPREEEFEEVVRLAARICELPISAINLIDAERQWFKAEVGLGARETPLDTSICAHVILEEDFVEIADTRADPRMSDNPLCLQEPGLRFYAGALLKTRSGLPIGTLCVLGHEPRKLTELQIETLRVLARQVMRQLELRLALRQEDVLRREIDHRVRNSLQTVTALISLEAARSSNEETRSSLANVSRRVESVALLHEELHQAGASDSVDLSRYMDSVGRLMASSTPDGVSLELVFDSVLVSSQHAHALAVIVNEFIANSVKHAFPDGRRGDITVRGQRISETTVEVVLADNGVGSAAAPTREGPRGGLGLEIIAASVAQLGGTLERDMRRNGARMTVTFPLRPQTSTGASHP